MGKKGKKARKAAMLAERKVRLQDMRTQIHALTVRREETLAIKTAATEQAEALRKKKEAAVQELEALEQEREAQEHEMLAFDVAINVHKDPSTGIPRLCEMCCDLEPSCYHGLVHAATQEPVIHVLLQHALSLSLSEEDDSVSLSEEDDSEFIELLMYKEHRDVVAAMGANLLLHPPVEDLREDCQSLAMQCASMIRAGEIFDATLIETESDCTDECISPESLRKLMSIGRKLDSVKKVVNYLDKRVPCDCLKDLKGELQGDTRSICTSCLSRFDDASLFDCECKLVKYCSSTCQKNDWKNHKAVCKEVRSHLSK